MLKLRWRMPNRLPAIGHARRLVRSATWDGSKVGRDTAELAASELVTNAIVHGAPPVELEVDIRESQCVRIAVKDTAPLLPVLTPRTTPQTSEGGRGLAIVDAVSTRWGLVATADGKQVWCEIALE